VQSPGGAIVVPTDRGLFCPDGEFHIDPWRPVARAVVTHAHADHAVPSCGTYLASPSGALVLRARLGPDADIQPHSWGADQQLTLKNAAISLHPAGHVLGSAQIRVQTARGVCVVTGDYKRHPDPTAEPFEPVPCDDIITESTFGLPIYRWPDPDVVFADMLAWWSANVAKGLTSVIFAYALGKAQRLLAGIARAAGGPQGLPGPIAVHGAVERINHAYAAAGVDLPPAPRADAINAKDLRGRGLIVAPPSADGTVWLRKFGVGGEIASAAASGWLLVRGQRRRANHDRAFVLSDHADWPALHRTIADCGASSVGVTHGFVQPMVRYLTERGIAARVVPTRYEGETIAEAAPPAAAANGPPTDAPEPGKAPAPDTGSAPEAAP
jgi:putative mRNA 3-end processing factor